MYRLTNTVIGFLNLFSLLASIPIIGAALHMAKDSTTCENFLQTPFLVIGFIVLIVSLAGFIGACFHVAWALWVYLVVMLLLIVALIVTKVFGFIVTSQGGGAQVPGRVYREFHIQDYSPWLRNRVNDPKYWNNIKSCIFGSKTCAKVAASTPVDYLRNDMTPIQMANINAFSNFGLRSILEKEKLNGNNFLDWSRNLRIVLKHEHKLDVLDKPIPDEPVEDASQELKEAYGAVIKRSLDVTCLMLASMVPDLQKQFEDQEAFDIMTQLKVMFGKQARTERFDTVKAILDSRLKKGEFVGPHVLKMKSHFENLERLGVQFGEELAIDIILHSLHGAFSNFIQNYNMNLFEKSINELHGMLKTVEQSFPHEPKKDILMVQNDKNAFKRKGKAKKPLSNQGKGKTVAKAKVKPRATPEQKRFYCNQNGHWKRNCPKYLKHKKDGNVASTSGTKGKERPYEGRSGPTHCKWS